MYVSQRTVDALMELIGKSFQLNRALDRIQSVVGVKFVYPTTAGLIHEHMAHWASAEADEIAEKCLERYNIPIVYYATPTGDKDYSTIVEALTDVQTVVLDYQSAFMACCKIAFENNDIHVYADLLDMLEDVNEVVEQAILLKDKIDIYGDKPSFDNHIKTWWFLGNDD